VRFTCQTCGRAYAVSDELSGRAFKMKCKACGQEIVVRPADPASGKQGETTGVVPLPVVAAVPPRPAPPPPVEAPAPVTAPPPPVAAPPVAAPPPPPPVEAHSDPFADLEEEMEVERAAAPAPAAPAPAAPPPEKPAPRVVREVNRTPAALPIRASAPAKPAPPKPGKPASTPPPRRSLLMPGIALLTAVLVLGVGISFLRAKAPDRAPVPPAPRVETPVLAAAPQPEPQPEPAAPPATSPATGAEPVAPVLSPAPPPARSPATARPERQPAARDLPVERAPAETAPSPARQTAAAAAPPPEPKPALVVTAAASVDVVPVPVPVPVPVAVPPPVAEAPAAAIAPAAAAPAPTPAYVADKFQSPRLASRTCIAEKLRLPSQLDDNAPEVVTVRVEVGVTGMPKQVQVMEEGVDRGISDAIRRAALACEWVPGTDAQGNPTQFWAVQPIRLAR